MAKPINIEGRVMKYYSKDEDILKSEKETLECKYQFLCNGGSKQGDSVYYK